MNKRIKDITIEEVVKECKTRKSCYGCPIQGRHGCILMTPILINENDLEKEVKI